MRLSPALLVGLLAGCSFEHAPPLPPPFLGMPPGPPAELGVRPSPAPEASAALAEPEAEAPPPAEPVEEAKAPEPTIAIEDPYRLDQRAVPATKEAFLADIRDRRRWNKGSLGELTSEPPPVTLHPMPRVIVDVTRVSGPHDAKSVQRDLRKLFWIKVVGCYGLGAYKNQKLRGKTTLSFKLSAKGRASSARATSSTLEDKAVVACLAPKTTEVELPKARKGSRVTVEVQVGPGDEPMPPPASELNPGEGKLAPEAMRAVVEEAAPRFEECYRAAFAYAPGLWGRLNIRFHITERGKVDEAFETETHFPDERVTLCALRVARALAFPKPEGGDMRFVVPIRMSSSHSVIDEAPASAPTDKAKRPSSGP